MRPSASRRVPVGVLLDGHLDLAQREPQALGGDLGERRGRALADVGQPTLTITEPSEFIFTSARWR